MKNSQPVTASTQDIIDIYDIKDDTLILKTGGAALVLQTTAVNFDLLSEREQDSMIAAYAGLLNSLSFPIQVVIRSKKMDVSSYLENLKTIEEGQPNEKLRQQIIGYRKFIEELITQNDVLDKKFYVVIPYGVITVAANPGPFDWVIDLFGLRTKRIRVDTDYVLKKAGVQLLPKRDHLIKEFGKVGIKARQLKTEELVALFYDIYNPTSAREQKIKATTEYLAPIVEPMIEQ
jgi:hypothetical protein